MGDRCSPCRRSRNLSRRTQFFIPKSSPFVTRKDRSHIASGTNGPIGWPMRWSVLGCIRATASRSLPTTASSGWKSMSPWGKPVSRRSDQLPAGGRRDPLHRRRLRRSGFIVQDELLDRVDRIRESLDIELNCFVCFGGQTTDSRYQSYESLIAAGRSSAPNVEVMPTDPWAIMYTSGTTGSPKAQSAATPASRRSAW